MILVKDAVAEVSREAHEAELKTMDRIFADVKTTDEVLMMLSLERAGDVRPHPASPTAAA